MRKTAADAHAGTVMTMAALSAPALTENLTPEPAATQP